MAGGRTKHDFVRRHGAARSALYPVLFFVARSEDSSEDGHGRAPPRRRRLTQLDRGVASRAASLTVPVLERMDALRSSDRQEPTGSVGGITAAPNASLISCARFEGTMNTRGSELDERLSATLL